MRHDYLKSDLKKPEIHVHVFESNGISLVYLCCQWTWHSP